MHGRTEGSKGEKRTELHPEGGLEPGMGPSCGLAAAVQGCDCTWNH